MNAPKSFRDEMVFGAFKSMKHEHVFIDKDGYTEMIDLFHFEAPLGPLGRLASVLFLKRYMRNFLLERNGALKAKVEEMSLP
ncbi:MAG: hypothetical protein RIC95_06870 [Vicingaceae bacterium]